MVLIINYIVLKIINFLLNIFNIICSLFVNYFFYLFIFILIFSYKINTIDGRYYLKIYLPKKIILFYFYLKNINFSVIKDYIITFFKKPWNYNEIFSKNDKKFTVPNNSDNEQLCTFICSRKIIYRTKNRLNRSITKYFNIFTYQIFIYNGIINKNRILKIYFISITFILFAIYKITHVFIIFLNILKDIIILLFILIDYFYQFYYLYYIYNSIFEKIYFIPAYILKNILILIILSYLICNILFFKIYPYFSKIVNLFNLYIFYTLLPINSDITYNNTLEKIKVLSVLFLEKLEIYSFKNIIKELLIIKVVIFYRTPFIIMVKINQYFKIIEAEKITVLMNFLKLFNNTNFIYFLFVLFFWFFIEKIYYNFIITFKKVSSSFFENLAFSKNNIKLIFNFFETLVTSLYKINILLIPLKELIFFKRVFYIFKDFNNILKKITDILNFLIDFSKNKSNLERKMKNTLINNNDILGILIIETKINEKIYYLVKAIKDKIIIE